MTAAAPELIHNSGRPHVLVQPAAILVNTVSQAAAFAVTPCVPIKTIDEIWSILPGASLGAHTRDRQRIGPGQWSSQCTCCAGGKEG
jgi:hypothetical protein